MKIITQSANEAAIQVFDQQYVHISIQDPGMMNWPLSYDTNRIGTLRLSFWDCRSGDDPARIARYKMVLPEACDLEKLMPFVDAWKRNVDLFVINCAAGISRSTGVAVGLSDYLGVDSLSFYIAPRNPNPNVIALVTEAIAQRKVQ